MYLPPLRFLPRVRLFSSSRLTSDLSLSSARFSRWLLDHGLHSPLAKSSSTGLGFALRRSPIDSDLTLVATADIPAHHIIFTLPPRLTLAVDSPGVRDVRPLLPQVPPQLWQLALGLTLLAETHRPVSSPVSQSFYHSYISLLPREFPQLPIFFPRSSGSTSIRSSAAAAQDASSFACPPLII
jgi:hypothetical protein